MSEVAERKVSKINCVKEAIAAGKTDLDEMVAWIKDEHGVEITKAMASSYKSKLSNPTKQSVAKKERKKKATAFVEPHQANGNGHGSLAEHVQLAITLSKAIDRHGVATVRTILEQAEKS